MVEFTAQNALLLMIFAHALADYPLQGEFLAKAKAGQIPGIKKKIPMVMHCLIHAGFVYLITGSVILFIAEYCLHYFIDTLKVDEYLTFEQDQALHIICKVMWWILLLFVLN